MSAVRHRRMRFNNGGGRLFKELSKTQKLRLAMILLVCGFGSAFYAAGIATNFLSSPVFSMFFIISYQTAHNIVVYVAVAAAIALGIAAVALSMVETPKKRAKSRSKRSRKKPPVKRAKKGSQHTSTYALTERSFKEVDNDFSVILEGDSGMQRCRFCGAWNLKDASHCRKCDKSLR